MIRISVLVVGQPSLMLTHVGDVHVPRVQVWAQAAAVEPAPAAVVMTAVVVVATTAVTAVAMMATTAAAVSCFARCASMIVMVSDCCFLYTGTFVCGVFG